MNKSLHAMMTQLNWQLAELNLQLQEEQKALQELAKQIEGIRALINASGFNSQVINPELEISRLSFIIQQHEKKENVKTTLKTHQEREEKLQEKIQRIKMELKMLEKYLERTQSAAHEVQQKNAANAMDEWIIQKRNAHENH